MVAFRLIVVKFDVLEDGLLELADAGERAAAQTLLGQLSKPRSTKFSQELLVRFHFRCGGIRSVGSSFGIRVR